MSTVMDDEIKRWTAKRKTPLLLEIIQGKTTVAEASRAYDMPPSEIEAWVDEGKKGMENALRANPQDVRERRGDAGAACSKKTAVPVGRGREKIETIRQGLKADDSHVSMSKLCRWLEVPRRTVYYHPTKTAPKVDARFAEPIKAMIEERLSFGYGLTQEFITPHSPEQNGIMERVIRTLKEQRVHRHRFQTLQHASRVIGDWISFYNSRRPHQALGMKTPAATYALAA